MAKQRDILYISPITDFGFKKCFSDEIVMKGFLTALYKSAGIDINITSITYLNEESDGDRKLSRRIIYDVKCCLDTGEEFIVEMQNEKQSFLDNRILYYMSRGISNQGDIIKQTAKTVTRKEKTRWNYDIKKVIGVYLLNFNVPNQAGKVSRNCIVDILDKGKEKKITNDHFEYWKIQLPCYRTQRFKVENCKNDLDYWLYNIANMDKMKKTLQFQDKTPALARLGEIASYHALTPEEQERYLKEFDDDVVLKDVLDVKIKEATAKGEKRGEKRGEARGRSCYHNKVRNVWG